MARGFAKIEQKNKFSVGETIEVMKPDGRNILARVEAIYDEEGVCVRTARRIRKQILWVDLGGGDLSVYDILREKEDDGCPWSICSLAWPP